MRSWLLLFLVFLFLIFLYFLSFKKASHTGFLAKQAEEKNISGWYVLGKVRIESGKVVSITLPQEAKNLIH